MSNASKDENGVSSLLGASPTAGAGPVPIYADPDTHRLLVDGIGTTGPTGPTGIQGTAGARGATGPTGPSAVSVADGTYTPVASITIANGIITAIATA